MEYLDQYEAQLQQRLLEYCTAHKRLEGRLLETPDITDKWNGIDAEYIADAIKEIEKYPTVALGWAMYVGMGVAKYWDEEWEVYDKVPNLYTYLRDKRGFDYLDEVVRGDLFGLKDEDFVKCEDLVRGCAQIALDMIRHEQIEPSSPTAFHVFARSVKVLYRIGAAVALRELGYNLVKL